MELAAYVLIAFGIFAAIPAAEAALRLSYLVVVLNLLFVSLPLSHWLARKVTGTNPYR